MAENSKAQTCPRCKQLADQFFSITPNIRETLKAAGNTDSLPDQVCPSCYDSLTGGVSQGQKLRMERDVREKNKMVMWKSRVNLIKSARGLMNQKAYSEAAVEYEKYLRVLELVYNLKKGELSPAVFNNSSRSKELTVIASVYWDLVRIYDTSPRYGERMASSANKLSQFLPFSPLYSDILKKAEAFSRSCKNPNVLRQFLKSTKSHRGPCFIADAAFALEPHAVELHILREFRDRKLRTTRAGRKIIWAYYRLSPRAAAWISGSQWKSGLARWCLRKIVSGLKKNLK